MNEGHDRISTDIQGWDAIADHRTGTPGDRQTTDWLIAHARAVGVAAERQDFELSRWMPRACTVEAPGVVIEGVPMFDGGTTGGEGVGGRLALLTGAEAVRESAAIGLGSFGNAAPGATRALAQARKSDAWQAIVAVSKMDPQVTGLAVQNADRFNAAFGPPVLQVATDHEAALQTVVRRGETVRVTVHVDFETATGSNVVCRIPGRTRGLAPLVVLTPKSAWWVCTAERGGGIAVWLALLRHFARNRPARDVCFVASSGHELGHLGLAHFLATPALPSAHAWIHLGANFAAVDSRLRVQAADADLLGIARRVLTEVGVSIATTTPLGERPGGEARNVHDRGERYLSLLGSNAWFHHPDDRWPRTIDMDRCRRVVDAVRAIAVGLASTP